MSTTDTKAVSVEIEYRTDSRDYGYVHVGPAAEHRSRWTRVLFRGEDGRLAIYNTRGYPDVTPSQIAAVNEELRPRCDELGWVVP